MVGKKDRRIIEVLDGTAMEYIIPANVSENTRLEFITAHGGGSATYLDGGPEIRTRHIGYWYPKTLAAILAIPETEEYIKKS